MRRPFLNLATTASFFLVINTTSMLGAGVIDRVVVVVNDEAITESEIRETLRPIKERYREGYYGKELDEKLKEARMEIIQRLIEDKLILQEAKRSGIEVRSDEVDARFNEVKNRFPSPDEFERILKLQELTVWQLKKTYREQLMVKKMVRAYVKAHAEVTPTQITEYYQDHKEDFKVKEAVQVSQILIKYKPDEDPRRTYRRASQVLELLNLSADFKEIAKRYSGGTNAEGDTDMGFVQRGQLSEDLEKIVFNMKEGEISHPVKTKSGFVIFKVGSRRPQQYLPVSEARDTIEGILLDSKTKDILKRWLEELKENAFISIKE